MWLKKILSKPPPPPQPDPINPVNSQFQIQSTQETTSALIDSSPDQRYTQLPTFPHDQSLQIPLTLLHSSQVVVLCQLNLFMAKTVHNSAWTQVNVILTDRQLIITPNIFAYAYRTNVSATNNLILPHGMIEKTEFVEIKKQPYKLVITLKDNRVFMLSCVIGDLVTELEGLCRKFIFVTGINKFYAFRYGLLNKDKVHPGWKLYDFKAEMQRQGAMEFCQSSAFKIMQNETGQICKTYPTQLIVPSGMTDAQLIKCSKFRTKERLPSMTYFYEYKPKSYSTIFRCSQNKVGMMSARCVQDEKMLQSIAQAINSISKQKIEPQEKKLNCKIYDARGYYAALGNLLSGKGYQKEQFYKCQLEFLNIPNIHAVRDTYTKVKAYNPHTQDFLTVVADSGWYDVLFLILAGAKSIACDLEKGLNVVVHCSDGWDRTSQLCSLAQLLIDPYYRTIEGLAVLVEKDWRTFGHKFRSRTGQYHSTSYHPHQKSQIFIQFLDCIYQIMAQFPLSFQFNHRLLTFLGQAVNSGTYGTFMTNNVQQSLQVHAMQETITVWSHVMQEKQNYTNPYYNDQVILPSLDISIETKNLRIWKEHFSGETVTDMEYLMMKQEKEINKALREQFYHNHQMIEDMKKQLKS